MTRRPSGLFVPDRLILEPDTYRVRGFRTVAAQRSGRSGYQWVPQPNAAYPVAKPTSHQGQG
jgi:hypothetical protein